MLISLALAGAWAAARPAAASAAAPVAHNEGAAWGGDSSHAVLHGEVNPQGHDATYHFEYGTTISYGSSVPATDSDAGSGSAPVQVTATAGGLTPGVTYHMRLVATGAGGTTPSPDTTFVAGQRQPILQPRATPVTTASSAQIDYWVNPQGHDTTAHLEYGPTDSYGSASTAVDEGAGGAFSPFSATLTSGLTPGTYHFRIVASSSAGTVYSPDATFVVGAPTVTTSIATATSTSATDEAVGGIVDTQGSATQYWFEYGTDTSYGQSTAPTGAGSTAGPQVVSGAISGLAKGTTYHYRLVAHNVYATSYGADDSFLAGRATAVTQLASAAASGNETLAGTVNPAGSDALYHFQYGTSQTSLNSSTPTIDAGSGTATVGATATIAGMIAGHTYYYVLVVSNGVGPLVNGGVQSFVAGRATSITGSATSVPGAAHLTGTVNPAGFDAHYYFQYGTTVSYGSQSATVDAGAGIADLPVAADVSGLQPGTDYHFRLVVTNAGGTYYGSDATLTTPGPTATTDLPAPLTSTAEQLNGEVDPHGQGTTYQFDYGATVSYGQSTAAVNIGSGSGPQAQSAPVTGLTPGTTYHVRIEATNASGTSYGADQTFTPGVPQLGVTPGSATATSPTDEQIPATVNPQGLDTQVSVAYGATSIYGSTTTSIDAGAGTGDTLQTLTVSGLTRGTVYHYQVLATNQAGAATSADDTFVAGQASAATGGATPAGVGGETVNGTVDPVGTDAQYWFVYGPDPSSMNAATPSADAGAGLTPVAVSAALGGLTPGHSYSYALVVSNGVGPAFYAAPRSFTAVSGPSATTDPASQVTTTGATLNGEVNPNGQATGYHFEYGTDTSYGTSVPSSDASAGSDTNLHAVSQAVTGLTPGTTYHYRTVATNGAASVAGADQTFTPGQAQIVGFASATAVGQTSATLNASINPNGTATTYHFEYGADTSYGTSAPLPDANLAGDTSVHAVSQALTGLTPGTTYHFRTVANNTVGGPAYGPDQTFFTTGPPVPITGSTFALGATSATVTGTVQPNGQDTTYHFEYGTTASYGTSLPVPDADAGAGTSVVAVSAAIGGLTQGTTYHYRLVATNLSGTVDGADHTFITQQPPAPTTGAASSVGAFSASLAGTVNPEGLPTTYHFEYGPTTSYGTRVPLSDATVGSDNTVHAVSQAATGLSAASTYHLRIVATNAMGTVDGADQTFTTTQAPLASTGAASAIVTTGATLNGTVNPQGQAATYHFEYGPTTTYGTSVPVTDAPVGSDSSVHSLSQSLTGLTPGTPYHYRIVASDGIDVVFGADQTFTTSQPPVASTGAASSVVDTSASLTGTANPEGLPTTYHFQYGTTTAYGTSVPISDAPVGSDASTHLLTQAISGLAASTTYHFEIVATSAAGTSYGGDQTLTTGAPPGASTGAASSIGDSGATVSGTLDPGGLASNYHFDYGASGAYGSSTPSVGVGAGTGARAVSAVVTGLTPNTTYHFRLVADNAAHTTSGGDQTLTTTGPAAATTGAATAVTGATAALDGTLDPDGHDTVYHFDYGADPGYGSSTSPVDAGSGMTTQPVSVALSGLSPGTTYHYRLVASSSAGTTAGADATVTTAAPAPAGPPNASAGNGGGVASGGAAPPASQVAGATLTTSGPVAETLRGPRVALDTGLALHCPAGATPCTAAVSITMASAAKAVRIRHGHSAKPVTAAVASLSLTVPGGRSRAVTASLTASLLSRLLAGHRGLPATVTVVVAGDGLRPGGTFTRTITVTRAATRPRGHR